MGDTTRRTGAAAFLAILLLTACNLPLVGTGSRGLTVRLAVDGPLAAAAPGSRLLVRAAATLRITVTQLADQRIIDTQTAPVGTGSSVSVKLLEPVSAGFYLIRAEGLDALGATVLDGAVRVSLGTQNPTTAATVYLKPALAPLLTVGSPSAPATVGANGLAAWTIADGTLGGPDLKLQVAGDAGVPVYLQGSDGALVAPASDLPEVAGVSARVITWTAPPAGDLVLSLYNNAAGAETVMVQAGGAVQTVRRYTAALDTPGHGTLVTPPTGSVFDGQSVVLEVTPQAQTAFQSWTVTAGSPAIANAALAKTTMTLTGDAAVRADLTGTDLKLTLGFQNPAQPTFSLTDAGGTPVPTPLNAGLGTPVTINVAGTYAAYRWYVNGIQAASTTATLLLPCTLAGPPVMAVGLNRVSLVVQDNTDPNVWYSSPDLTILLQ